MQQFGARNKMPKERCHGHPPSKKILVVDDSKTELMFMTDLLQKNGFA